MASFKFNEIINVGLLEQVQYIYTIQYNTQVRNTTFNFWENNIPHHFLNFLKKQQEVWFMGIIERRLTQDSSETFKF